MGERMRAAQAIMAVSWRADPWRTAATVVMGIAGQAASPLYSVALGWLTDAVVASRADLARNAIVLFGLVILWSQVLAVVTFPMRMRLREVTTHALDLDMADLAGRVPGLEHFERAEYADKVELLRATRLQLAGVPDALVYNIAVPVQIIVTAAVLSRAHPALVLLPVFGLPLLAAGRRATNREIAIQEELAEDSRVRTHLFGTALSNQAAKEVRVFGIGSTLIRMRDERWQHMERRIVRTNLGSLAVNTAAWLVFAVGYIGAITLVVNDAVRGRATAGDVVLAVSLAAQVRGQIGQLNGMVAWLLDSLKAGARYVWLADHARQSVTVDGPASLRPTPDHLVEGIRFDGVTFRYPGTDVDVLREVDLFIPAGSTVAVVGDNGAGKSTLVKLLARYYEPTSGRITVDGVDLSHFDVENWRTRLSAGFQDFVRFELAAREAVGIGQIADVGSDDLVTAALDRASATGVVDELPGGLDTQLGKSFEGGLELSGGQWQKLALGRSMMREDPILLLLDEPTAALDAPSEHALFERYAGAARRAATTSGAITLLVSHRFSTVRMADLILVVDDAVIAEAGDHATLMAADGLYAELYELQARSYR